MLAARLLYEQPVTPDRHALLERLHRRRPDAELLADPGETAPGAILFAHPDHPVEFADRPAIPVETAILPGASVLDPAVLMPAVQQSWNWPEAREVGPRCRYGLLISDLVARNLEARVRLGLFVDVVAAAVEVTQPLAIHWVSSQKLSDPGELIRAVASGDPHQIGLAVLNVRLFNIEGEPGGMVMDTLGLGALSLSDLQIHFQDLAPAQVAALLYNYALYILDRPDWLKEGATIPGVSGRNWTCLRGTALVPPKRPVWRLEPEASPSAP